MDVWVRRLWNESNEVNTNDWQQNWTIQLISVINWLDFFDQFINHFSRCSSFPSLHLSLPFTTIIPPPLPPPRKSDTNCQRLWPRGTIPWERRRGEAPSCSGDLLWSSGEGEERIRFWACRFFWWRALTFWGAMFHRGRGSNDCSPAGSIC